MEEAIIETVEHYVRDKQISLARSLDGRAKVYLDLNFWIKARNAAAGERVPEAEFELLRLLRQGVANGALFCPISDTFFLELMKQRNTEDRRIGTARLVDELSLGVAITNSHTRVGTEIDVFLLSALGLTKLCAVQELIWTKLSYVMGEIHPRLADVDSAFELQVQKELVEEMWSQSLSDLVRAIGDTWDSRPDNLTELAAETNAQRDLHAAEITNFAEAYDKEVAGGIEACSHLAADAMCAWAELNGFQPPQPGSPEWLAVENMLRNLLFHAFKKAGTKEALRTLHIEASLHASMRCDKPRRFKPNDFHDFHHAAAAIGYCDAFLTEGPLCEMTTRPQLALGNINGCRIVADVGEAVEYLRGVSGRDDPKSDQVQPTS